MRAVAVGAREALSTLELAAAGRKLNIDDVRLLDKFLEGAEARGRPLAEVSEIEGALVI